jgi:hypothetical protein
VLDEVNMLVPRFTRRLIMHIEIIEKPIKSLKLVGFGIKKVLITTELR